MKNFRADHPECWMCRFMGVRQSGGTELHHIAGRGNRHNVRENYSALCRAHHQAIQSRRDAELICLVLKREYDEASYNPEIICDLRGWATSWMTDADVDRTQRIMWIMREAM